jgi:GntR family transcriptional regulator of arabinose operon
MDNRDKNSKKYQVIKQEIRSWILSGKIRANEQVTIEIELAKLFDSSRNTVRQAIGELVNEGYLYRIQGKGTFVSNLINKPQLDSRNIGLITSHLFSNIFPNIVQGAENVLRKKDYGLILASTDNIHLKERECLESCLTKSLQGLIIEPTLSALPNPNIEYYLSLEEKGIPYIMTNSSYLQIDAPALILDDEKGSFLAVEHLVGLGHKRIAGIFHREVLQGTLRMKGFINALKYFGVPLRSQLIGMYNALEKLERPSLLLRSMFELPANDRPTAVVCFNDEIVVSLLDTIREMGLGIPEDLSIVGFDDSYLATATEVKITSVVHPKEEMGRLAAQILLDSIEKNITRPNGFVFEPKLVIRQSTGIWKKSNN